MALQFATDLRRLAAQASSVGEDAFGDLRTILDEALTKIRTEIFEPEPRQSEQDPAPGPDAGEPAHADPGESPRAETGGPPRAETGGPPRAKTGGPPRAGGGKSGRAETGGSPRAGRGKSPWAEATEPTPADAGEDAG